MKSVVNLCLSVLIFCTIHEFVLSHNSYVVNYQGFQHRKHLRAVSVFMSVKRSTIVRCMKECVLHRRCRVITFRSTYSQCVLGDSRRVFYTRDSNTVTSPISWTLPEEMVGRCANHTCSNEEMCMDFTNMPLRCQTTQCPKYVGITHSIATSNGSRAIGQEFPIVCPKGTLPTINKTKCEKDGQWTALTNFKCLNCSTPIYENHVVVSCYNYPSLANQTYAAAKNVCETVGGKVPRIDSALRDSYFQTATDGVYWIEGGTETDAESMQYDDATLITYRNYEVTNTTICGGNATECGIAMSSSTNNSQMYIRDKTTEPQLVVCQMVLD